MSEQIIFLNKYADLEPDQISHAFRGLINNPETREEALKSKFYNPSSDEIHQLLDRPETSIRARILKHMNVDPEHIERGLNDPSYDVRMSAANNRNATSVQIFKALRDPSEYVRARAALNPSATDKHRDLAVDDPGLAPQSIVANHHKITKNQMVRLLKSKYKMVQENVKMNPKYFEYFPNGHEGLI